MFIFDCHAMQMSKAFLDEYGLLPPLLGIMHVKQAVDVLLMGLACVMNILSEEYKINKFVEAGLVGVARLLSGHEDELVQQYVAGILLAVSSCSGLEEWLVSASLSVSHRMPPFRSPSVPCPFVSRRMHALSHNGVKPCFLHRLT